MNRIKAIFISTAITLWAVFSYLFIKELVMGDFSYYFPGFGLASVVPFGFFLFFMAGKPPARTSRSLTMLTLSIAFGTLLVAAGVYRQQVPGVYLYLSLASMVLWLLYVFWYSALPVARGQLKPGDKLPELNFIEDGQVFSTTSLRGKKVIYLFYRGNWCPLCMAQVKEITARYQELHSRGVEVCLISPQPARLTAALAGKMAVAFRFLTDKNNAMARKLQIDHQQGTPLGMEVLGYASDTVLPTVMITDEEGRIAFVDQTDNYRLRPEPETFLRVIDDM